ncbi:hypothetical protein BGZ65_007825, partial [Modicella reniformis]
MPDNRITLKAFREKCYVREDQGLSPFAIKFGLHDFKSSLAAYLSVLTEAVLGLGTTKDSDSEDTINLLLGMIMIYNNGAQRNKLFKHFEEVPNKTHPLDDNSGSAKEVHHKLQKKGARTYLAIGPGEISSDVTNHYELDGLNITEKLMAERTKLVNSSWEFADISQLLALNFIFMEDFLNLCFDSKVVRELTRKSITVKEEDSKTMGLCGTWANKSQEEFQSLFNEIASTWDHPVCRVVEKLTEHKSFWIEYDSPHMGYNEGTYQASFVNRILDGIFSSLSFAPEFVNMRLPMPVNHDEHFEPDYFGAVDEIPFLLVE